MNEINLLRRLEGNKRVIRLIDSEVQVRQEGKSTDMTLALTHSYSQVTNGRRHLYMVMECGEIDLNKLMLERSTEPLEMDWVKYYWRQVRSSLVARGHEVYQPAQFADAKCHMQMLQAVQVIHDEKIVHSDLKPANFVLVKGAFVLVTSFSCVANSCLPLSLPSSRHSTLPYCSSSTAACTWCPIAARYRLPQTH